MYIRFETNLIHPDSRKPAGILQAINYLEEECVVEKWQDEVINEVRDVMVELDAPDILNDLDSFRLLSWFKPEAKKFIDACHELMSIFEMHNIVVYVRREKSLESIVYEDDYQVLVLDRAKVN